MRIDKNYGVTITVYKGQKFLGKHFDGFRTLDDIRGFVRENYKDNGIVEVNYWQDQDSDNMRVRTRKQEVWRGR